MFFEEFYEEDANSIQAILSRVVEGEEVEPSVGVFPQENPAQCIIASGDVTLGNILNATDALAELTQGNSALIDMLSSPTAATALVGMLSVHPPLASTVEGGATLDEATSRLQVHPHVALQLLTCKRGISMYPVLKEAVVREPKATKILLDVWNRDDVDPVLGSYVVRVLLAITDTTTVQLLDTWRSTSSSATFVTRLVHLIGISAMVELVIEWTKQELEADEENIGVIEYLCKNGLIQGLVDQIVNGTILCVEGASRLLVELVTASGKYAPVTWAQSIEDALCSCGDLLMTKGLLHASRAVQHAASGVLVAIARSRLHRVEISPWSPVVQQCILPNAALLADALKRVPTLNAATFGVSAVGATRIMVVGLVAAVLASDAQGSTNHCVASFLQHGIVEACLDLVWKHPLCSIASSSIADALDAVWTMAEQEHAPLAQQLIELYALPTKIAAAVEEGMKGRTGLGGGGGGGSGMTTAVGVLLRMARSLQRCSSSFVQEALKHSVRWMAFVEGSLARANEREEGGLGGPLPDVPRTGAGNNPWSGQSGRDSPPLEEVKVEKEVEEEKIEKEKVEESNPWGSSQPKGEEWGDFAAPKQPEQEETWGDFAGPTTNIQWTDSFAPFEHMESPPSSPRSGGEE